MNRRNRCSLFRQSILLGMLALAMAGCGSERLGPDDFKRREREEVIVDSSRRSTPAQPATEATDDAPAAPSGPEDLFREAALNGDLAAVQAKAQEGVEINAADPQGRTALQLAAFDGHLETVKWLIAEKADINHRDQFGRTALMYASTGDNLATVEALLAAGAEVNLVDKEESFTALMFAAAEGQEAIVRRLLDSDADPTMSDADGETASDFAKANGHAKVLELLSEDVPQ
ncbi:ankyrin repeat domain-containing protein [Neorhodopirellula pilleata]|uniref:Ankyrin repeats (3 copies) n=1 Tax=Neorhodopirellula pilleata TaxID=2714738 RepID=A0A5C6A7S5_9BACT|nr:ankyrin repeat domain-containing protein [Neorhodopirellula pilleata]TWT95440.1 Ankyrin repeats (3 copies) [Neorhodopirellula pilleata]